MQSGVSVAFQQLSTFARHPARAAEEGLPTAFALSKAVLAHPVTLVLLFELLLLWEALLVRRFLGSLGKGSNWASPFLLLALTAAAAAAVTVLDKSSAYV